MIETPEVHSLDTALEYLEKLQAACKHDQPLMPTQTDMVCRLCWKAWQK